MQKTKIEYLMHTWNPIAMRCTPVSEGCAHCWHLRMANRMANNPVIPGPRRMAYADAFAGGKPMLVEGELAAPLRRKKPSRIGVQFMGDIFHENIPFEWIAAIYGVMAASPQHTFFILSKRIDRMLEWYNGSDEYDSNGYENTKEWLETEGFDFFMDYTKFESIFGGSYFDGQYGDYGRCEIAPCYEDITLPWPLPNVIPGASVENQKYDQRIWELMHVPSTKRFISYEPALGPLDAKRYLMTGKIHLVVAGAETGPGARPCNPDWLRSVRDQCAAAGVPFFLKQINARGDRDLDGRRHEEMI